MTCNSKEGEDSKRERRVRRVRSTTVKARKARSIMVKAKERNILVIIMIMTGGTPAAKGKERVMVNEGLRNSNLYQTSDILSASLC